MKCYLSTFLIRNSKPNARLHKNVSISKCNAKKGYVLPLVYSSDRDASLAEANEATSTSIRGEGAGDAPGHQNTLTAQGLPHFVTLDNS